LPALQRFYQLSECKTNGASPGVDTTLLRRAVERPTPSPLYERLEFSLQVHWSHRKGIATRRLRRPENPPATTGIALA